MADNRSQALDKAQAWKKKAGQVISQSDVKSWVASKEAAGKSNPNILGHLERQLGKGAALGASVVQSYNQGTLSPIMRGAYGIPSANIGPQQGLQPNLGGAFGAPSANIGGMRGLQLGKGQVYMGAARVGESGTAPIVLPRSVVQGMKQPKPAVTPAPTPTPGPQQPWTGPSAADVPRDELTGKLTTEVPQFAPQYLPGTAQSRQEARRESLNLAAKASQQDVVSKGQIGIRDFYTKNYAQFGNSPSVFGMQDLLQMENTGASPADIQRTALTIGSIGPEARKRMASKYGITL